MAPSRHILFFLVLLIAAAVFFVRQQGLSSARRSVAEARVQVVKLHELIASAELAANAERQQSKGQKATRNELLARITAAEQELAKIDPDSRWATPPENSPEWNEESPYVWLRKTMLSRLPLQPFSAEAELRGGIATALGLDGASPAEFLNADLRRLASEYHALETSHAERIDEPLPGIADDGPQVTVRVNPLPEEGSRIKKEFENALANTLGDQRAALLLQAAGSWLDGEFSQGGSEPKTISAVRHPNGTYNVSLRTGYSWFSTGGVSELDHYVPNHLLPLFSEITEPVENAPLKGSE